MKLLLFDIDMTLISTGGAGIRALNRAFRQILDMEDAMDGIPPHGKTDPAIIREVLQTRLGGARMSEIDRLLDAYVAFLREEVDLSPGYRVLPGIPRVLDELFGKSQVLLGLATGNVEAGARIKLERGRLNSYFTFGGFGSDSESRTELVRRAAQAGERQAGAAIPAQDTFVIGDTPKDIDAGREAGFYTIGVATGTYSTADLAAAGAHTVLEDFERGRDQFLRTTSIA